MARKRSLFFYSIQSILKNIFKYILFALSLILAISLSYFSTSVVAQTGSASILLEKGSQFYQLGQFDRALTTWQDAAKAYDLEKNPEGKIGSVVNQAKALESMGQYRRACKTLVEILIVDRQVAGKEKICETSTQMPPTFLDQKFLPSQEIALENLGNVMRVIGNLEKSKEILELSWQRAKNTNSADTIAEVLLNLGNTARDLGNRERDRQESISDEPLKSPMTFKECPNEAKITVPTGATETTNAITYYERAIEFYQQSVACNPNSSNSIRPLQAKLNQLSLLIDIDQWLRRNNQEQIAKIWTNQPEFKKQIDRLRNIESDVIKLPHDREGIYARINFARSLTLLECQPQGCDPSKFFTEAIKIAKLLQDQQAESYAIGNLGWMYEQTKQPAQLQAALKLTQEALSLVREPDIIYQWQWQLGRILVKQNESLKNPEVNQRSIEAYESAVRALEASRRGLLATNPDAQFSFRDNVEPVYRELVGLLLQTDKKQPSQENLKRALYYIDSLQLAELENFLQCDLSGSTGRSKIKALEKDEQIAQVTDKINQVTSHRAAFIYPIILRDRVAVIYQLPSPETQILGYRESSTISRFDVKENLEDFRVMVSKPGVPRENIESLSKKVYEWIIRPVEVAIGQSKDIDTLVFVLDGSFRRIPLVALYDSNTKKYLVEKEFSIAVSPTLQLIKTEPLRRPLSILIGAVDKKQDIENRIWSSLATVNSQIEAIKQFVLNSELLLNENFTPTNLEQKLRTGNFSTIHLATHGQFSSNPNNTVIVASGKYIRGNDFGSLVKASEKIELLVLSVCDTAKGDNRATLGLAGIAISSGANSTLATLYEVKENYATELVAKFYENLVKSNMTRAKALHSAQKDMFEYTNFERWTGFTLIGDWL